MRPFLVFMMGTATIAGLLTIAEVGKTTAQSLSVVESATAVMGEPSAKSLKSFRDSLLKAAGQSVKDGEISRMDLMRLRIASMSPKVLERMHQAASEQLLSEGMAASFGAIDWSQLLAFIKEIIPIILELIKLFS